MKFRNGGLSLTAIVLSAHIFFSSCAGKKNDIPADVIGMEELAPVLADMHIAQASMNMNRMSDSLRFNMCDYTDYILKSRHITKERYHRSLSFYSSHPELMDSVYRRVIDELSRKQSEAERRQN